MKAPNNKHLLIGGLILILVAGYAASQASVSLTSVAMQDGAEEMMAYDMDTGNSVAARAEIAADSFMPMPAPTAGDIGGNIEARVIREGWLSLEVDTVEDSVEDLVAIAEEMNGLVDHTNVSEDYQGRRIGSVTVRIPSDRFSDALARMRPIGIRVTDESTNAQDVTEQYTDLETRLSVARTEEQAYLELLDRATSVSELLEVQRELSNVRVRIESLEGQLQYLENRTDYSTIHVSLEEEATVTVPTKPFRFVGVVKDALRGLVQIGQGVLSALVWGVVIGVGVGVPAWLVYLAGRGIYRSVSKRK